MTRWSEADLAGRLLAEEDGEEWKVLNLPALAEDGDPLGRSEGEALWPERYPVEALEQTRRALGSYLWSALYQGRPAPLEGHIFKRDWFRYWKPAGPDAYQLDDRTVPASDCRRFITCDLAVSERKSADFTVAGVFAVTRSRELLLLDLFRKRIPGPEQVPMLKRLNSKWEPAFIGIEAVAFQLAIVQQARREGLPVRELKADKDKVSRALVAAARMEGGDIYLPHKARWLHDLQTELLLFPNARHDDQTDVLAYAARSLTRRRLTSDPARHAAGIRNMMADLAQPGVSYGV